MNETGYVDGPELTVPPLQQDVAMGALAARAVDGERAEDGYSSRSAGARGGGAERAEIILGASRLCAAYRAPATPAAHGADDVDPLPHRLR